MKTLSIQLPVSIFKEGKAFVAYSPALDISTCADTLIAARKQFNELVQIFFEELDRNNTKDEVLFSLGWEKRGHEWLPPHEVEHGIQSFEVPTKV